jgi:hypothetical protein
MEPFLILQRLIYKERIKVNKDLKETIMKLVKTIKKRTPGAKTDGCIRVKGCDTERHSETDCY